MKIWLSAFIILYLFLQSLVVKAQLPHVEDLHKIIQTITQRSNSVSLEKIYLQTDKPFYATGDTMWIKDYLFNAAYLTASPKSGIAYVEIANEENKVVKRMMMSLFIGLGGEILYLKKKSLRRVAIR